jgi:hypothetical protein
MYYPDSFKKPNPFEPNVVVSVDGVMDKKLEALGKLVSQFHEGGANGGPELADPAKFEERDRVVKDRFRTRNQNLAGRFRPLLVEWYGAEKGNQVKCAEAFELCEYGQQPDKAALKQLFPFAGD